MLVCSDQPLHHEALGSILSFRRDNFSSTLYNLVFRIVAQLLLFDTFALPLSCTCMALNSLYVLKCGWDAVHSLTQSLTPLWEGPVAVLWRLLMIAGWKSSAERNYPGGKAFIYGLLLSLVQLLICVRLWLTSITSSFSPGRYYVPHQKMAKCLLSPKI